MSESIIHLLHRAGQAADIAFADAVGKSTLTARQSALLIAIRDGDTPSQTDLVNATGIDRSTMADMVRRLQRQGLVFRARTRKDARRYAVKLTPRGVIEAERAAMAADAANATILAALPETLQRALQRALERVAALSPPNPRRSPRLVPALEAAE